MGACRVQKEDGKKTMWPNPIVRRIREHDAPRGGISDPKLTMVVDPCSTQKKLKQRS